MNILEQFSLQDKVVVLTGGGGLYGRQLTAALAEAGAKLVLASRNQARLQEIACAQVQRGYSVACESLDQGDEGSVLALRDKVLREFGRVDGLVNNAVLRPMKSLDAPVSAWDESLRVNATGVFLMTRAFGEAMLERRAGSIVNVGSMMGVVGPSPEFYEGTGMGTPAPDYFFHKAGMINLTRYFASVFGARDIRVNCVSPGGYFTHQPEPFLQRYNRRTMLGRMAGDTDLGGAVVFLLSDASRYVTGVNLPVDGGYTAK
ncbi:MAG TPA: SDR family oxidoreductase [Candidatus Paceibacterota bacterium]|nr:SDR family oxidoreductase [Verrucomicrobiota bacterium]HSA12078.1 SDR family oxidoreductase [Candidatus Paceibacterota bacterium]